MSDVDKRSNWSKIFAFSNKSDQKRIRVDATVSEDVSRLAAGKLRPEIQRPEPFSEIVFRSHA